MWCFWQVLFIIIIIIIILKPFFLTLCVDPSQKLLQQIFPWIEQEKDALKARSDANLDAHDFALKHFLELLQWFRLVLLQDAAVLSTSYHGLSILHYPPFNTSAFYTFAKSSTATIAQAEEDAQLALHNLPQNIAHSFRGMVAGVTLEQQHIDAAQNQEIACLTETVQQMMGIIQMERGSKKRQCQKAQQGLTFILISNFILLTSISRC